MSGTWKSAAPNTKKAAPCEAAPSCVGLPPRLMSDESDREREGAGAQGRGETERPLNDRHVSCSCFVFRWASRIGASLSSQVQHT